MWLQIAALGLLDSLNVLTIAIVAYLLGTPLPVPRTLAYIAGKSIGYFSSGVLLLVGWQLFNIHILPLLSHVTWPLVQIVVGLTLIAGGFHSFYRPSRRFVFRPPTRISPRAVFLLGLVIGLVYAPTDPRHNVAVSLIITHADGYASQIPWLLWFNLFYIMPLCTMVLLRVLWPEPSRRMFGWVTDAIGMIFYQGLPVLIIAAGAILVVFGGHGLMT